VNVHSSFKKVVYFILIQINRLIILRFLCLHFIWRLSINILIFLDSKMFQKHFRKSISSILFVTINTTVIPIKIRYICRTIFLTLFIVSDRNPEAFEQLTGLSKKSCPPASLNFLPFSTWINIKILERPVVYTPITSLIHPLSVRLTTFLTRHLHCISRERFTLQIQLVTILGIQLFSMLRKSDTFTQDTIYAIVEFYNFAAVRIKGFHSNKKAFLKLRYKYNRNKKNKNKLFIIHKKKNSL
jgi:hypothetical protein